MTERKNRRVRFVSFSGVDGAGKSTQIDRLTLRLQALGLRVRVIRFWDELAVLTQLREGIGHKVFKGEKGVGSPEAPVNRRDKNVNNRSMTCLRLLLYLLDTCSSRKAFKHVQSGDADIIIFDRYMYDEWANLDWNSAVCRSAIRVQRWIGSRPDIGFVLDAHPEAARSRKPEYPLEFIYLNRARYIKLSEVFEELMVIPPGDIDASHEMVFREIVGLLGASP